MRKFGIFILAFLMIGSTSAGIGKMEELVAQATLAYSDGDYTAAIQQYEQVIQEGYESAGLYFNLGNAHFKMNNIPAAILYYEKSSKLDPTDENTLFNLDLANTRIIDKIDPLPELFLKSWFTSIRNLLSSNQWATSGIIGFVLLLASVLIFINSKSILFRKFTFYAGIVFLIIMISSFLLSYSGYREYTHQDSGIIFTPTVTVKSSPTEQSVDLFVIHEGTKVLITDDIDEWSEIRLANGNVGWVKKDSFKLI